MSELEPLATRWDIELVPNLVKRIFRQVLEREHTPVELINYGCKLARGEMSIKEIIQNLILEEEYEDRFIEPYSEEIRVKYCFNHLLARDPTPDETQYYKEISVDEGIDNVVRLIMDDPDLYIPGDDDIAFVRDSITSGVWIYLQANNGNYVCAEKGGGRELIANRYKPLGWETFTIGKISGGGVISVNDKISLRASNAYYVSANYNLAKNKIVANLQNKKPYGWETFTIGKVEGELGEIGDGDLVWLKANRGQFVCIDKNDQLLCANSTSISDPLAQFIINIQYLR